MYDKQALAEELRLQEAQYNNLYEQMLLLRRQAEEERKRLTLMQRVERILAVLSTLPPAQQNEAVQELRRMAAHASAPEPKEKVFPARYGNVLYSVLNSQKLHCLEWPMHANNRCGRSRGYEINEAGLALLDYLDRQNNSSTLGVQHV